jgi:polysaccharide deacetylase family protein (PEP-CTERM system associated)
MKNAISFDIEDWFHRIDTQDFSDSKIWDRFNSSIEISTNLILDILEEFDTKSTFFIVGWVAQKYPSLIKRIAEAGHEIACHSFFHKPVHTMQQNEFREDLRSCIDKLQELTGKRILGFRAPGFSIFPENQWAFETMIDLGLRYDSSLLSSNLVNFKNILDKKNELYKFNFAHQNNYLLELPVSSIGFKKMHFPYCGGGYLRLLPKILLSTLVKKRINCGKSNVLYLHPRDLINDHSQVKPFSMIHLKNHYGISSTKTKLNFLLKNFEWSTCAELLQLG